ncbi:hypothetical protein D9M68_951940 [compost metagenome]
MVLPTVTFTVLTPSAPAESVQLPASARPSTTLDEAGSVMPITGTSSETDTFTVPSAVSPSVSEAITLTEPRLARSSALTPGWLA